MKKIQYYTPFILVILLSVFIRFAGLTYWPPVNPAFNSLRVLTALISVFTIIIIMFLAHELHQGRIFTFLMGMILSLTPWHIEQSRVVSPIMWAFAVLLSGFFVSIKIKSVLFKLMVILITITCSIILFPQLSEVILKHHFPKLSEYLQNWFKLISVEFLFYKNDSFWLGGFRTQGAFLSSTILVFLVGLIEVAKNFNRTYLKYLILFLLILSISAAAPKFPEQQIFFLTLPFFIYIFASGLTSLIKNFMSAKPYFAVLISVYALLIIYDYILFTHFYIVHYTNRIRNELTVENINF